MILDPSQRTSQIKSAMPPAHSVIYPLQHLAFNPYNVIAIEPAASPRDSV